MLVNDKGRPYCERHARLRSEAYVTLADSARELRGLVAGWVEDGTMALEDAKFYYDQWGDEEDLDDTEGSEAGEAGEAGEAASDDADQPASK